MTIDETEEGNYTALPSVSFDETKGTNETVYLAGWHIHAPADHSVQGDRSKAELHMVHVDAKGHERAVLAIRIDPGNSESAFFKQLPNYIGYNATDTEAHLLHVPNNMHLLLDEINNFSEYWTCEYHTEPLSVLSRMKLTWNRYRQGKLDQSALQRRHPMVRGSHCPLRLRPANAGYPTRVEFFSQGRAGGMETRDQCMNCGRPRLLWRGS